MIPVILFIFVLLLWLADALALRSAFAIYCRTVPGSTVTQPPPGTSPRTAADDKPLLNTEYNIPPTLAESLFFSFFTGIRVAGCLALVHFLSPFRMVPATGYALYSIDISVIHLIVFIGVHTVHTAKAFGVTLPVAFMVSCLHCLEFIILSSAIALLGNGLIAMMLPRF